MIVETTARKIGKSSIYILVPPMAVDWMNLKHGQKLKMEDSEDDSSKTLKFTKNK
jgi:hypothetical protein